MLFFIRQKIFAILLLLNSYAFAAVLPINFAQTPLFLGSPIKPNIFLLIDNSGSMSTAVNFYEDSFNYSPFCSLNGSATSIDEDKDGIPNENEDFFIKYYSNYMEVVKTVASNLICEYKDRMYVGFTVLDTSGGHAVPVTDTSINTNLENLLQILASIQATGGSTPLRASFNAVGEYFDETKTADEAILGFPDDVAHYPYLSESDGGACQRSFVMLITDGYYNGSYSDDNNYDAYPGDTPYDFDSQDDKEKSTLADIAQNYYERDLAPSLPDLIAANGDDNNPAQHLVTFGISIGLSPELKSEPSSREEDFNWYKGKTNAMDDLKHASWNGRGGFFSVYDPQQVSEALGDIFAASVEAQGSFGPISYNYPYMPSDGSAYYMYKAEFSSVNWEGDVKAYKLNVVNNQLEISKLPIWSAKDQLQALDFKNRDMYTHNGVYSIKFEGGSWNTLSSTQQADLMYGGNKKLGQDRIDYILGDDSNVLGISKKGIFRPRGSLIGDIVYSGTVYVGAPELYYPESIAPDSYIIFKSNNTKRFPMVYTATNGAMVHGFSAKTGDELFVYIPRGTFSGETIGGLHYLTDPIYEHQYYADQKLEVFDAYFDGSWHTVLVGALGLGGQGIYALDITDPESFNVSNVLWDATESSSGFKNLGYLLSRPKVVALNTEDSKGYPEWAVIFANGYNSDTGKASLYIVDISDGDLIKEIVLPDADNGLSDITPVDINADGTVDFVYAGDLRGNLWKFNLTSETPGEWDNSGNVIKLYSGSSLQPITSAPVVALNPVFAGKPPSADDPNLIIAVGSGRYLAEADDRNIDQQHFIGIYDNGEDITASKADLVAQPLTTQGDIRIASNNLVNFPSDRGWYIDLPLEGERVIYSADIRSNVVYFSTLQPLDQVCGPSGVNYRMAVDLVTGGESVDKYGYSNPALDVNQDGLLNDEDLVDGQAAVGILYDSNAIAGESSYAGDYQVNSNVSEDNAEPESAKVLPYTTESLGRLSWQELLN